MGSQKRFFSLEHFREWMEQIYLRKWVSGEGKRLDSENKHIFYTLGYLLFHHAAPGVLEFVESERIHTRPISAGIRALLWMHHKLSVVICEQYVSNMCIWVWDIVWTDTLGLAGLQLVFTDTSPSFLLWLNSDNYSFETHKGSPHLQICHQMTFNSSFQIDTNLFMSANILV